LILYLVIASFATRGAIVKAVLAKPDADLPLAEAAILLAIALLFGQLALRAVVLFLGGRGHARRVARGFGEGKFRW
jgi:hypothetical protein